MSPQRIYAIYKARYQEDHAAEISRVGTIDLRKIHLWCFQYESAQIQQEIEFSFSVLDKIIRLLEGEKVPLVIVTVPLKAQLVSINGNPPLSRAPIKRLRDFCQKRGVLFHCPDNELAVALKNDREVYFTDNMHLNYRGQEIWADTLSDYLSRNRKYIGLLSPKR